MVKTTSWKAVIGCTILIGIQTGWGYGKEPDDRRSSDDVVHAFTPPEEWFLPTGYEIKATIQNAIFSYNLVTPVVAEVDESAICPKNNRVVLPKKTRLIGTADILKSDDRVNIKFLIAVLPNGREFEIAGTALSPDGTAGIKGDKKEYKDVRLMASAVGGALQGVGQAVSYTMGQQPIAAGAIQGALQQGSQQAQEISSQKVDVSISVPRFQKTQVFLARRLVLDIVLTQQEKEKIERTLDRRDQNKSWKE